jgi:O-acetyl-ADP-ribose deacetylase (regulator of RNase III)
MIFANRPVMGTPYYMAPEQAEDPHGVDTRADIYSFGATFYHALTGRVPFDGTTAFNVLFKHKTEPLIAPQSHNPELSDRVSQILERCLSKSPRDRFQTFAQLISHLDEASGSADLWDDSRDTVLRPFLQRYYERRDDYLNSGLTKTAMNLVRADFSRSSRATLSAMCDAIVSSDDSQLSMGWRLVLHRHCRRATVAKRPKPLHRAPGRVIVTRAGQLRARLLSRDNARRAEPERVLPSRDVIAEILKNCFHHADTLHVQSMAIPQVGAGVGGFPKGTCLDMMFRFVARTLLHKLTGVREVRIVFLDDRMGALKWWAAMAKRRFQGLTPNQQRAMDQLGQVAESMKKELLAEQ